MIIGVKNNAGVQTVPVEALLAMKRILFVQGEITDEMAVAFAQQVIYYNMDDPVAPIKVFINSDGGEINAGMAMYDVIQSSRAPILLYCVGKCYSMAAVLLACGKKGNRFILPHGKVMIHEPLIPYGVGGKSSSVQTISESLLKAKREMDDILAAHTGKKAEEIAESTKTDRFFDADEAVGFGLVDGIKEFAEMVE